MRFSLSLRLMSVLMAAVLLNTVVLAVYSGTLIKEQMVQSAQQKLKGDLALGREILDLMYPGDWSLKDGDLYKGATRMNANFAVVDRIGELTGDTATIFQGDVRVATNVRDAQGARAVGTKISKEVGDTVLGRGAVFVGKANVVGTWNQTAYEPIRDREGKVIGIWYVGVPNTPYDEMASQFQRRLLLVSVVTIALILPAIVWQAKSIARPIAGLSGVMRSLETGDLTKRAEIRRNDEVADVSKAINSMVEGFRQLLDKVLSATKSVMGACDELRKSAGESTGSTEQIAAAVSQISEAAQKLSRSIQDTATSVSGLSRLIDEVYSGAARQEASVRSVREVMTETDRSLDDTLSTLHQVSTAVDDNAQNSRHGAQNMREVVEGIEAFASRARHISSAMTDLAGHSDNIRRIADLIENISKQTNMLSINAAIEAARAGKQGQGFSVVADEVRKLAESTSKETRAIRDIIARIRQGINECETAAKEQALQASQEASRALEVGSSLEGISNSAAQVQQLVTHLTKSSAVLKQSTLHALEAVQEAYQVTEQNQKATKRMSEHARDVMLLIDEVAALSEESASTSEEVVSLTKSMSVSIARVSSAVGLLTQMAADLDKASSMFRL